MKKRILCVYMRPVSILQYIKISSVKRALAKQNLTVIYTDKLIYFTYDQHSRIIKDPWSLIALIFQQKR